MIDCKACRFTSAVHKETIEKELLRLKKSPNALASEAERDSRLLICSDCRRLDISGACMMCGCYVILRASLKHNKCPMKYW